jgi:hypothetical protein
MATTQTATNCRLIIDVYFLSSTLQECSFQSEVDVCHTFSRERSELMDDEHSKSKKPFSSPSLVESCRTSLCGIGTYRTVQLATKSACNVSPPLPISSRAYSLKP